MTKLYSLETLFFGTTVVYAHSDVEQFRFGHSSTSTADSSHIIDIIKVGLDILQLDQPLDRGES